MASASAAPEACGYNTALKAMITENEHGAPEALKQNYDDYVHVRVSRENMRPLDNGLTETVQYQASLSVEPHNAAPGIHSFPVQLPVPASQLCGGSSTIPYARDSVIQPDGSGDTSVDTVETEPHLEALTHHVAGSLAVPRAPAAVDVKMLMDSGPGIAPMSQELMEALRRHPQMMQTAFTNEFIEHKHVW